MPDYSKISGMPKYKPDLYSFGKSHFTSKTDRVFDLLSRMLEYDPDKRVTAKEALAHPWFSEPEIKGAAAMFKPGMTAFAMGKVKSYPKRRVMSDDTDMVMTSAKSARPSSSTSRSSSKRPHV